MSHPSLEKQKGAAAAAPMVVLKPASTIECRPIRWLWPGWLARGKLHVLAGSPGTGKTTIALAMAATVTTGGRWPDGKIAPRGRVLIWSGEDDAEDTLVPRLSAAGADLSRVLIVGDTLTDKEPRAFDPASDLPALEWQLREIDDVSLLIADPIVSAVGAADSHKNTEVRRALQPLVNLGARLDCAVVGISHFSKGTAGRDPTERVTGSVAFGALARVVMVTAKSEEHGRLLARSKSNIGPDGGGFAYELGLVSENGIEASKVGWGNALEGSARELLSNTESVIEDSASDAASFLSGLLATGSLPAKDVYREAEGAGFSRDQMKRAKSRIGVRTHKAGMAGGWVWHLPVSEGSEEREAGSPETPPPSLPSVLPSCELDEVDL